MYVWFCIVNSYTYTSLEFARPIWINRTHNESGCEQSEAQSVCDRERNVSSFSKREARADARKQPWQWLYMSAALWLWIIIAVLKKIESQKYIHNTGAKRQMPLWVAVSGVVELTIMEEVAYWLYDMRCHVVHYLFNV